MLKRRLLLLALMVGAFVSACTSAASTPDESATNSATDEAARADRLYTAEWIVDAAAIGRQPAYAYRFVEIVDDRNGTYFVTGPQHLALQTPPEVVFCAGLFPGEPRCASTDRPENTPNVLALGLSIIRDWHPESLYEVADYRRMDLIADSEPDQWERSNESSLDIAVECFTTRSPDANTPDGLKLCYTADEYRLLATVDMNGDEVHEVYLERYDRFVDEDQLDIPFEILDDAKRYEQLLVIFPDVPLTPTPTPVPTEVPPTEVPEATAVPPTEVPEATEAPTEVPEATAVPAPTEAPVEPAPADG